MIILLQSVKTDFRRLFWQISYDKVQQNNFIIKCDKLWLRSVSDITKCSRLYYKMCQVLQSVTVVTDWDIITGGFILICSLKYTNVLEIPMNENKEFLPWYFFKAFFQILSNLLLLSFRIPRAIIFDSTSQWRLLWQWPNNKILGRSFGKLDIGIGIDIQIKRY